MEGNDDEAALILVRHLERLQGQWQGILQTSVYNRLMGFLLEEVVRGAMDPLLAAVVADGADDTIIISESCAQEISRVFRTIARTR